MAIASIATSIAGLVLACACGVTILACPVGAVLGHVALGQIERTGDNGKGLAITGIIVGWLGTLLLVAVIAWFVIAVAAA